MKKAQYLTPVVTAFDESGNLDKTANEAVYDHLIRGGIDGIVVMGSTGEFFTMTMAQKRELIDIAAAHIKGRVKLYVGTSCMSAAETAELSNYARHAGADGVMVISPYYFALSADSVERFYDHVASETAAEIFIYNFPDRTGYDITPDITLRLLRKHKNIVGYKDTVSMMGHTRSLIEAIHPEFPAFQVFSGYDENLAHVMLSGGSGCIGGLSNLAPELFAAWADAIDAKDVDRIEALQRTVNALMELYDIGTPFIPIMKKAMMLRGVALKDCVTVPFIPASEAETKRIEAVMKKANLL